MKLMHETETATGECKSLAAQVREERKHVVESIGKASTACDGNTVGKGNL